MGPSGVAVFLCAAFGGVTLVNIVLYLPGDSSLPQPIGEEAAREALGDRRIRPDPHVPRPARL